MTTPENPQAPAPTDIELVAALCFMVREGEDLKGDSSRIADAQVAIISTLTTLRAELKTADEMVKLGLETIQVEREATAALRSELETARNDRDTAELECAHFRLDSQELDRVKAELEAAKAQRDHAGEALQELMAHLEKDGFGWHIASEAITRIHKGNS